MKRFVLAVAALAAFCGAGPDLFLPRSAEAATLDYPPSIPPKFKKIGAKKHCGAAQEIGVVRYSGNDWAVSVVRIAGRETMLRHEAAGQHPRIYLSTPRGWEDVVTMERTRIAAWHEAHRVTWNEAQAIQTCLFNLRWNAR